MTKRKFVRRPLSGFTLIELMIAVAVAGILVAIAIPTYSSQIRKSRRTEAKTALLDLAGREERYFNTSNNTYTNLAVNLAYAAAGSTTTITNFSVGSGYYQVTVTVTAAAGIVPASYSIKATPLTTDQQQDTACQSFTVDSTGKQSSVDSSSTDSTATCWK